MKYIKTYLKICLNANLENRRKTENQYYELHHIKPTSLGGTNLDSNKVLLTAREHYIVHMLLYKHFKSIGKKFEQIKMAHAWFIMSQNPHGKRITSKTFEYARLAMSEALTGRSLSESHKDNISLSVKQSWTEERKVIQTERLSGIKHSGERNQKKSAYFLGRPQKSLTCPHCGKVGGNSNMKRYHFTNCKLLSL